MPLPSRYVKNPGERLWPRLTPKGECWEWMGSRNEHGYGGLRVDKVLVKAHRLAWELTFGPIPAGLDVLHHCDNPPCCNPVHLFLGTALDNSQDMVKKGRHACASGTGHLPHGTDHWAAKLTPADVADIRRAVGTVTISELARRYGVARATVRAVRDGQTWKVTA